MEINKLNPHIASAVLMIEPISFGFNKQTAGTNSFQKELADVYSQSEVQELALAEFKQFVGKLENEGIEVLVFKDTLEPHTPDSIFPNNWFSTSNTGDLFTYPMAAINRSYERRQDILEFLQKKYHYNLDQRLVQFESKQKYLEGTGSLLIDSKSQTAFVAISPRADEGLLEEYAHLSGNSIVSFRAFGPKNEAIYHTNVMLCIGDNYAVIGKETIASEDQERVCEELRKRGKELIFLSNEQVYNHFAGNMLQLQNKAGKKYLVMSSNAKGSLSSDQIEKITSFGDKIIDVSLPIIEQIGGGSARCMMAEIFLKMI